MRSFKLNSLAAVALLFAGFAFSGSADAQTRKTKPKPLATPVPKVLTDAEIISRAADLELQQPAPGATPQTTDSATSAAKQPNSNKVTARRELDARLKKLESQTTDYENKRKLLLLNLDILTRAEARSETLRKQLFELTDKENAIKKRLDQIDYDIQPEQIERTLQLTGSMRPEEVRENKRKSLEAERTNLNNLLNTVESSRASMQASLDKSDELVEKLRAKLEKDIDDSLADPKPPQQEL